MDKDYLNFLERMGSFGMELGDRPDEIQQQVNMVNPAKKSLDKSIITEVGSSLIKSYDQQVGHKMIKKAITDMA